MTIAHLCGYFLPVVNQDQSEAAVVNSLEVLTPDFIQRNIQYRTYLLLAGAAAGVTANFNAPLAGVFYALEIGSQLLSVKNYQTLLHTSSLQSGTSNGGPRSSLHFPEMLSAVVTSALVSGVVPHAFIVVL